ncbi:hypothetical protein SDC9_124867 [bioreactor metagenome]|uniref:Uncharacterized protein n=1 Tax=bioreactor metagenome TaxID=1076179 RepID=A0A645CLU7_9ZZZZ
MDVLDDADVRQKDDQINGRRYFQQNFRQNFIRFFRVPTVRNITEVERCRQTDDADLQSAGQGLDQIRLRPSRQSIRLRIIEIRQHNRKFGILIKFVQLAFVVADPFIVADRHRIERNLVQQFDVRFTVGGLRQRVHPIARVADVEKKHLFSIFFMEGFLFQQKAPDLRPIIKM